MTDFSRHGRPRKQQKPEKMRIDGQMIRPVEVEEVSHRVRKMIEDAKLPFITRNSRCPCGSGKRFKRCCMNKR